MKRGKKVVEVNLLEHMLRRRRKKTVDLQDEADGIEVVEFTDEPDATKTNPRFENKLQVSRVK
jgi:hypothetical protein